MKRQFETAGGSAFNDIVHSNSLDTHDLIIVFDLLLNQLDVKVIRTTFYDHGDDPRIEYRLVDRNEVIED